MHKNKVKISKPDLNRAIVNIVVHVPPILSFPLVISRRQHTTEVGFMVGLFCQTPPFTACWLVKHSNREGDRCGPSLLLWLEFKPSCCCKHTSLMALVNCTIFWKHPQPKPAPPPAASSCQGFTHVSHCRPPCSMACSQAWKLSAHQMTGMHFWTLPHFVTSVPCTPPDSPLLSPSSPYPELWGPHPGTRSGTSRCRKGFVELDIDI